MNSASACSCSPSDQFNMVPSNWTYRSAQIALATIAGEQCTDIEIQTADGDKVTLSSDIKFESSAVTYEELGRTNASYCQSRGQIISATASSNLELSVEGNLDEQEKKDIKEVLMILLGMVKDFLAGKAGSKETHDFAEKTTISAVNATFDMDVGVTMAELSSARYVAQKPVLEKPELQAEKGAIQPALSDCVDKLTDRMIRFVKDSDIEPSRILKRLKRRLARISGKFTNPGMMNWHKLRLRKEILEDFARKLQQLSAENETEIKNNDQVDKKMANNQNEPAFVETDASVSETRLNAASQNFHLEVEYSAADDR